MKGPAAELQYGGDRQGRKRWWVLKKTKKGSSDSWTITTRPGGIGAAVTCKLQVRLYQNHSFKYSRDKISTIIRRINTGYGICLEHHYDIIVHFPCSVCPDNIKMFAIEMEPGHIVLTVEQDN